MSEPDVSDDRPDEVHILTPDLSEVTSGRDVQAMGGGLEGAERTSRETLRWNPRQGSPDQIINLVKMTADSRGRDSVQNDGYGMNAVAIHKDGIVGSQYKLNSNPNWQFMGATQAWADEFQKVVESRFGLAAESEAAWFDAARKNTFTGIIRLAVGSFCMTGEALASAEWIRETARPFKTAIQMISPDRLTNPHDMIDTQFLRRGVTRDLFGKPLSYTFRQGYLFDFYGQGQFIWNTVNAYTPWGRKKVIHIIEQMFADQTRGVADMVSVLKQMRMTKQFQDVTLQNAVVNASYAAAIESELPGEVLATAIGSAPDPMSGYSGAIEQYLGGLASYLGGTNNIRMDGVMIPHLYPGTKLNLKPVGTPGGVGTAFEASLLRHAAAGLGVSYEELAKDYSKVSYSSARTSIAGTARFMASRKKAVADRFANDIFALWLEEDWNAGNLPVPKGMDKRIFYQPLFKEAITRCTWIGAGSGQIDELKETQAAILRIQSGLSTYEYEIAKLGGDWRERFVQSARESGVITTLNLPFQLSAKRPLGNPPPIEANATDLQEKAPPAPAPNKQPPKRKAA